MNEQRNIVLAIVVSIAILMAFEYFYTKPRMDREYALRQQAMEEAGTPPSAPEMIPETDVDAEGWVPTAEGPTAEAAADASAAKSRSQVIAESPRVRIDSPKLHGSLALVGGRIDDITLADYHEEIDPASSEIILLSPPSAPQGYFSRFGWIAASRDVPVPDNETVWQADGKVLSPGKPVTLSWDNGHGLKFQRVIALDENYMFTVTQRVKNAGDETVTLYPYGLVSRSGTPPTLGFFILHEGLIGVFDGILEEVDYDDLQEAVYKGHGREEKGVIKNTTTGGWLGITDKYWLVALVPDQQSRVETRFKHKYDRNGGRDRYQVDFKGGAHVLAPGARIEVTSRLFAGAKEVSLLDAYVDNLGIPLFDRAVDFGWFYFLTKPIFYLLSIFNNFLGNFGLAILSLTVIIRLFMFPLANKSFRSMNAMKRLQPEIVKLRERFTDDRARMNQEMMAIYKREKVNPAAGCLPLVVQIPVFFSLYKVLFVSIEMRQAPFYGWIHDLSAPDPTTIFNLFGLFPWDPPQMLMLGVWPIIMGVTMFLQQKLNPPPADPMQAKIFMFLPLIFTVLLASFPAGLVIYWAWNNVLSIAQQWFLLKQAEKHAGGKAGKG